MKLSLPCVLASLIAAMTTTATATAAEQRLEVLFIAEAAGPIAYVEVTERADGDQLSRSAAWVFFSGGRGVTKILQDSIRANRRAPLLVDLPSAPSGLAISSDDDGTLIFTLEDLGDWQAALHDAAALSPTTEGPAVSTRAAARLLVEPPEADPARAGPSVSRATLYGTGGAIRGHALVDGSASGGGSTRLIWPSDGGLQATAFGAEQMASARTFVADRVRACGRAVPTALLLWPEEGAPTRLVASAVPGCLPSGRAIVPLGGVRLESRRETPIRAVLVAEPSPGEAKVDDAAANASAGEPGRLTSR